MSEKKMANAEWEKENYFKTLVYFPKYEKE